MTLLGLDPNSQLEEWTEFAASPETAVMLLDACGRIGYCSLPEVLSANEGELEGKFVNAFIPGLPLRPRTPGYNVAYVRFYFGDGWKSMQVTTSEGSTSVEVKIKAIPMNHSYCFVVLVRSNKAMEGICPPKKRIYPQLVHCSA